ncbi:MAG TPA: hypothetical protein VJU84_16370 [Pyrinomonadaceae bacterium]|nr:hypothetical protein [Pyrinomonadaceae bacterium]
MTERVVRLGIDYGTSFSKVVFRDYGASGRETAYVLGGREFRIPSAVGVADEGFVFGVKPSAQANLQSWHESIKMRVAGEVAHNISHYFHGQLSSLPNGFCSQDLAVLSVAFLISRGKKVVRDRLKGMSGTIAIGFTLGIPMSFFDHHAIKKTFLRIARAAWELTKLHDIGERLGFDDARHFLTETYGALDKAFEVPASETKEWIRPEAEAALWWPFMSPAVSPGPYAQVDIGAGTTNIGIFRIVPKHTELGWIKSSLSFFGATSPPVGMDAIDKVLSEWKGGANPFRWRGREEEVLYGKLGQQLISNEAEQIRDAYKRTINKAFSTHLQLHAERHAWGTHKIFFLGGGSLLEPLREQLRLSPLSDDSKLEEAELDVPGDIKLEDGTNVPRIMFPHVAVAYGLSGFAAELPNVESPSETPPMSGGNLPSRRYQMIEMDDWRY